MDKKTIPITLCKGVEGLALYVNDRRVWGNKPWGGVVASIFSKDIEVKELEKALEGIFVCVQNDTDVQDAN